MAEVGLAVPHCQTAQRALSQLSGGLHMNRRGGATKSALSIVLIVGLTGALPVSAQEPGPIARGMDREAKRLALQPESGSKRSSRIKKDVLIGAGSGAGTGALLGRGACSYSCDGATV